MLFAVKHHLKYFYVLFHTALLINISLLAQIKNTTPTNFPDPIFEHLTIGDGLPENSVMSILQDHLGYLWLGTQNGLVRYDGYEMKVYQPDPDDSLSLSHPQIWAIYEDKSRTLWIGTPSGGLNRFDRSTETFTRYMHNPDDSTSINSNFVLSIYEDNARNFWVGTNNGLNLFDRQNESFRHIHFKGSVYSIAVNAIIEDQLTGNLYVGSNNKILTIDKGNQHLTDNNGISELNSNLGEIKSFHHSTDETLWIGHSMGLSKFNSVQNIIKLYQRVSSDTYIPENDFYDLIEDNNGLIWVSNNVGPSNNGLICFDPKNEQFKRYKHNPDEQSSIGSNAVRTVYKDQSGIIWVGTFWAGLNKWDRNKNKFKRFSYNSNGERFKRVFMIIEDSEGIIWLGTANGINSFDRFTNEFRNYRYAAKDNSNRVNHIYKDETGIIWFGTRSKGLVRFDPVSNAYHFYSNDPNDSTTISHNQVESILPGENDVLWIGTWGGGLNKFKKNTGTFTRYTNDPNIPQSLSQDQVMSIYEDRKGLLWIGTNRGGLNKFEIINNSFSSFNLEEGSALRSIISIYEDHKGNFWVGTYHSGIYLFDRNKEVTIYNINQKDGLANNLVKSILDDDSGNLWIGTDNGLSRFNPETHSFKNYFTSDVFEENRYHRNSSFKTSTGEMLFGTYDGFIMFHPDSIKDDPIPPQVVISNVSLFNRPGEKLKFDGFISELDELDLLYDENDLRFDYVGLHFGDPEKNQYKYMLENFDEDWVDVSTQRIATYTNLDAGEYVFRVSASNRDGVWNEEGASLTIIIPPPFWATWWAYSVYVLFALGLLYGIRRYELNRTQLKNQVKLDEVKLKEREETDKMKSRFFANISHEFRTPLTLMLGPAKDVIEKTKESHTKKNVNIIKRNAGRLYGLVNQLLDLSKLEAGKMPLETREQNIIPLLKGLVLSFSSLAEKKKITLKFNTIEENLNVYIDKDKIEKIINNLLSNAFKFTPKGGSIDFTVEKLIKEAEIKISDSGVGIPKDTVDKIFDRFFQVDGSHTRQGEGTGIGLALTKELVELHKGKIKVESKEGEGTKLTVLLPLGKGHLKSDEICEAEKEDERKKELTPSEDIIPEPESRKEKTGIDVLIDTDKPLLLIAEDNPDVRKYIIGHLEEDYRIQEAVDGEDGLEQALDHIPDLIISDVMMPKMDGFELCNKLKTDEKTSHIPIIMLTAKATSKDKIEGYETGADDYIMKPFDATELKARIKNLIAIRRKLQEKFSSDDFAIPKELNSIDERFLNKVLKVINEHIAEENFSIELLSKESAMSKEQIYKKLKALTGKSPSLFVRSVRLVRAKKMIKENKNTISEISYLVGFSSPAYFTKCFKEEFGNSPSDLQS
jgi:signal transduction histidine kinase/ligand-binding sensor domain-containing protein/DNA-binding response OmpR family regulator